nr:NUDIX hydrolase [Streptacidiphilus rugosus]
MGPTGGPTAVPQFQEGAPARYRSAAGALFTDDRDRVLLVKPSYKPLWEIPGGCVEEGESPLDACVREVFEELSIRPFIGSALVVEWVEGTDRQGHFLVVFDGGTLSAAHRQSARPDGMEVLAFSWFAVPELDNVLVPALAGRVTRALDARRARRTAYLERGRADRLPAGSAGE